MGFSISGRVSTTPEGEKIGVLVLQVRVDKAVCVGQDMLPNCL